ncbi:BREX-1 system adenine-specific DNA-methyltransferase PglX [Salmonella enterica]|uniref:BREX-1 system adenine-specific DNA-methyltransferase PglX n=1 Tax=Salmonella enterica TaxID=28901 RepID=A0A743N8H7_SALER|nr:hypothetical protein LFZ40_19400 [Salmonella enterica subsp. enterica serovar Quebec str. S-1267]EHP7600726.1 BREX-1 system adenine-specific DNA-methyltransferase PglX [Salmonella enterica]HAF2097750.1 BREX-1 system adenine-specific DNA-methyltransferase PglX [Salmonella enterica]
MNKSEGKNSKKNNYHVSADDFKLIPGNPLAYWAGSSIRGNFSIRTALGDKVTPKQGLATGDNDRFTRVWCEVSFEKINFNIENYASSLCNKLKWVPYSKGGGYRKWYGYAETIVFWEGGGQLIRELKDEKGNERSRFRGYDYYFLPAATWGKISSGGFSCRYRNSGYVFDVGGMSAFKNEGFTSNLVAILNSKTSSEFLNILSSTLNFELGDIAKIPLVENHLSDQQIHLIAKQCINISKLDWDSFETSWDFRKNPLLEGIFFHKSLKIVYQRTRSHWYKTTLEMQCLEEKNNRIFIDDYGLQHELTPEVTLSDITLGCNPYYRYGVNIGDDELEFRLQSDTISEVISYIIGCQMGRYSLDREGLVYANEGNKGFFDLVDEGAYKTFPADEDGILPLMDSNWFDDDVTARVKEFVRTVWGEEHLQENLDFIAESLCLYAIKPKKGESSLDTIRRYLSTQFWKDHMKMYKKRPIYWLFSSGKEKAFECLVYLHRYNEGTLSRMRTEYVVPLLARYQGNIDLVNDQLKNAESGAATTRLKKELDGLTKKFNELRNFDDRLRHYADRRITIDLDDGVKVNYGKFGDLLADVKAITGSAPQEA